MKIGIDIDGVLFPWTDAANEALVAQFGIADPGPHRHWNWLKEQITPEQWAWLWSAEGQDVVFGQVERVYPGAVEAVLTILRDPENRCHFVTHRDPRRTAVHTATFLARHFASHPWAGVHVLQNGAPKHKLARWDVFIDDKPETVYDLLNYTGAKVFVPARPWNEELTEVSGPRLVRYRDPQEIAAWVAP